MSNDIAITEINGHPVPHGLSYETAVLFVDWLEAAGKVRLAASIEDYITDGFTTNGPKA